MDAINETIKCHPCHNEKTGRNPYDSIKQERQKMEKEQAEKRFEREFAYRIALDLVEKLKPHCEIVEIAGSIRRKKLDVKDIEIVVLPKTTEEATGLFDIELVRSRDFISEVKKFGKIVKGSPEDGRYVQIELPKDIKLDLFIPTSDDFYRQYAIRTGSADYAKREIAYRWTMKGWCGTENGLRRQDQCIKKGSTWVCTATNPVLPPIWKSEKEFFQWIGAEYKDPELRI